MAKVRRNRRKEELRRLSLLLWGVVALLVAMMLVLGLRNMFARRAEAAARAQGESAAGRASGPGSDDVRIGPSRTPSAKAAEEGPSETESASEAETGEKPAGFSYSYPMKGRVLTAINLRKGPSPEGVRR